MKVPPNAHLHMATRRGMRQLLSFVRSFSILCTIAVTLGVSSSRADTAATGDVPVNGVISGTSKQQDGRPGTPAGFEIDGNLVSQGASDWFPANKGNGVLDPNTCAGDPAHLPREGHAHPGPAPGLCRSVAVSSTSRRRHPAHRSRPR